MKNDLATFLKGLAMGAANVIPGVSGGTIAFITGIYERLIEAIKNINLSSLRLLLKGQIRELAERIDLRFLVALGLGVLLSLLTLAQVLEWGFEHHPQFVWALFFGLIAASVPMVGKLITRWSSGVWLFLLVGLAVAVSMAFLTPAGENRHPLYLLLCGVVAMCSMIIPGLSGSFVLLLMGNYKLIMLESIIDLKDGKIVESLTILWPVILGALVGMIALSRILSWLFRTYHDLAVGLITGFVAGSLVTIWPWKDIEVEMIEKGGKLQEKIIGFENWHLPDLSKLETFGSLAFVLLGIILISAIERLKTLSK